VNLSPVTTDSDGDLTDLLTVDIVMMRYVLSAVHCWTNLHPAALRVP
jgi:hypothetical protein